MALSETEIDLMRAVLTWIEDNKIDRKIKSFDSSSSRRPLKPTCSVCYVGSTQSSSISFESFELSHSRFEYLDIIANGENCVVLDD